MKATIFNLIILDESGSMDCIRKETIMGCNEILDTIKAAQKQHSATQEHFVSIYAFQDGETPSRYLIRDIPAEQVEHLNEKDYVPEGCTPLLDAVGTTVNALGKMAGQNENAIGSVTIITDGMENSSREYSHAQIAALVKKYKEKGWNFNFIGANIDSYAVSHSINIENSMDFEQSSAGTKDMFIKETSCRRQWLDRVNANICCMEDNQEFSEIMKSTSKNYFGKGKDQTDSSKK